MKITPALALVWLTASVASGQPDAALREKVRTKVSAEYASLFELYKTFHANPELSFQEEKTSARLADELKRTGYEVTTGVGKFGVVAVLKNGSGPTVLVRSDLDGLPVKEQTGLPFASKVMAKDDAGNEVSVMHACGHDIHMTCLVGVAQVLASLKEQWHGTLVLIGQPAEERGGGARAMIKDGLFTRFPKPDVCLMMHDKADLPAGMVGWIAGPAMANVDSVDITVHGIGGHGAWPHTTKDPVVLASQIVLALQTIVSREVEPGQATVVTVGSIHGGTKHNIISDEVKLQLTVRSYTDDVRKQTLDAIQRIARGQGVAAGLPEDKLPEVKLADEFTPALHNDPALAERLAKVLQTWLGEENVRRAKPVMGGEDFSEYGRTPEKIPVCLIWVGAVKPEVFKEYTAAGKTLPSLHTPYWAPDAQPTIQTGVTAMTAAVLELMKK